MDDSSILKRHLGANARIDIRVSVTANPSTLTADADNKDMIIVTALAQNLTIAAPTGTPVNGQALLYRIKDNGTSRTLSWNAVFRGIGVTPPTSTTASKTMYVSARYNSLDTKWDILSIGRES